VTRIAFTKADILRNVGTGLPLLENNESNSGVQEMLRQAGL
jgi:hypothetical protein